MSRPGDLQNSLSVRQISGCAMIFVMVYRGKSFENLGYDAYVACKYVLFTLCTYVICRATKK